MSVSRLWRAPFARAVVVALLVFLAGLPMVLVAAIRANTLHTDLVVDDTETAALFVSQSLELAVSNLSAIDGFFRAADEVTPEEFQEFASSLHLDRNPNAVAVARRVPAAELNDVRAQLRAWYDIEPYELVSDIPAPLGSRSEYYIVTHQFGLPNGQSLLGLDFASVPARRALLQAVEGTKSTRFGEVNTLIGLGTEGFPIASPMIESGEVVGMTIAAAELQLLLDDAIADPIEERVEFELEDLTGRLRVTGADDVVVTKSQGGRVWQLTGRPRTPFSYRPYFLALVPLLLVAVGSGGLTRLAGRNRTTRDELDRVEAENRSTLEHQATLERFEVLASNATDMVTRNTLDGTCLYASPSAERILGYTSEWLQGKSLFDVIHPDDHKRVIVAHEELVSGSDDTIEVEYRVITESRETRWFDSVSRLVVGVNGVEVQASTRDITDKVAKREELRHAQAAAVAAGEAKAQFIANISHEIRTPLNAIAAMTDMALASDLTGNQREYLQVAKTSAQALMSIVNDVLDLSKAASGNMTLDEEGFVTRDVFSGVIRSFEPEAQKRDLELILAYDDQLPEGTWGDPGRIRQILINLVGNALKFTHAGSVTIKVTRPTAGGIRCDITDTGIGIPADRIGAIFNDFTQAEGSTTRNYGGTGLGLGISRRLTEMMGGRIWVSSEAGQGSTFTFELPLEAWEPQKDLGDERTIVRIITGDPDGTEAMSTLLGVGGRQARRTAVNEIEYGDQAIIALVDGPSDPLGVQACRASNRVLIVDGSPGRGNSERFRRLGAAGYVGRPAEAMDLLDLLDAIDRGAHSFVTRHDLREQRPIRHVLVADDVATNRLVVERLLSRRGHVVTAVGDGRQAVEAMEVERYDIVLMDVQMPVMDGLAATRLIREKEAETDRHTPIIALTGRAMDGDQEAASEAGCDGYMIKPFNPHQLCVTVEELSAQNSEGPLDQASTDPLDPKILDSHTDGDLEVLATLLDSAREEAAEQRRMLDTSDTETVGEAAHKLKGMLGMIGASPASRAAATLEHAARSGDVKALPDLLSRLDEELIVMTSAIDSMLGRSEPVSDVSR